MMRMWCQTTTRIRWDHRRRPSSPLQPPQPHWPPPAHPPAAQSERRQQANRASPNRRPYLHRRPGRPHSLPQTSQCRQTLPRIQNARQRGMAQTEEPARLRSNVDKWMQRRQASSAEAPPQTHMAPDVSRRPQAATAVHTPQSSHLTSSR